MIFNNIGGDTGEILGHFDLDKFTSCKRGGGTPTRVGTADSNGGILRTAGNERDFTRIIVSIIVGIIREHHPEVAPDGRGRGADGAPHMQVVVHRAVAAAGIG